MIRAKEPELAVGAYVRELASGLRAAGQGKVVLEDHRVLITGFRRSSQLQPRYSALTGVIEAKAGRHEVIVTYAVRARRIGVACAMASLVLGVATAASANWQALIISQVVIWGFFGLNWRSAEYDLVFLLSRPAVALGLVVASAT